MVPPNLLKKLKMKTLLFLTSLLVIGIPTLCAKEKRERQCNTEHFLHDILYIKNLCDVSETQLMTTEEYLDNMELVKAAAECLTKLKMVRGEGNMIVLTAKKITTLALHQVCPAASHLIRVAESNVKQSIFIQKTFSGYTSSQLKPYLEKLKNHPYRCINKRDGCTADIIRKIKCQDSKMMFCRKTCNQCFDSSASVAENTYLLMTDKNTSRMDIEKGLIELHDDEHDNPGSYHFSDLKGIWNVRGTGSPNPLVQGFDHVCVEDKCKTYDLEECQTLFYNKAQHVYSAITEIKGKKEKILAIMKSEHKDCDFFTPVWDSKLLVECTRHHFGAEPVLSYRGTNGYVCPSSECSITIGNLRPLVVNLIGTANYYIEYDKTELSGKVTKTKAIHLTMPDDRKSAMLKIRCGKLAFEKHVFITTETYCRSNFPSTYSGQFAAVAVCVYYKWLITLILILAIIFTIWAVNKLTGGRAMMPVALILTPIVMPFYWFAYKYILCDYCCTVKFPNHKCPLQCTCGCTLNNERQVTTHKRLCKEVNKSTFRRVARHLRLSNVIYLFVIFIAAQVFIVMYVNIEYLADDYIKSTSSKSNVNIPLVAISCILATRWPKMTLAVLIAVLLSYGTNAQEINDITNKSHSLKHLTADELRKSKDLEWLSVVKEVLKTDTEALIQDGFHPASLEIKTNNIIFSGLNLDNMQVDGSFTSGSILAQIPMAEGSAIGYNIRGPSGSKPVPLIIYIRQSRVIRDYSYFYSTFPEEGSTVKQNEDCVQRCGTCYSELSIKAWEATHCWNEVQHWGCEKSGCLAVNSGALCLACTGKYDIKNGADVFKFSNQKSLIELCIKLNSHTFCRPFDRLDSLDGKEFGILVSLVPTSADLMAKDYLVYYRKKKLWLTSNKVCGWNAVECSDFGNPQYTENDKGTWLNNFKGDVNAQWDCVAIGSKIIHVGRCFKNTFSNVNGLSYLNRHTEVNETRSGKTGYPGKVTVSQRNLYLGVGTVKIQLDKLVYTEMESSGEIKVTMSHCTGCYNCKLGLSCRFEFATSTIGRVELSCKQGIVRHPDIALTKTGRSSTIKILDVSSPDGKLECSLKSKGKILSTTSTTYKATLGDPTVYVEQKVDPTISTDLTKNCGFICWITSAFDFSSWFNVLKAIGIILLCVILFFIGSYILFFLVKACLKMKGLASDLKKEYDEEKQNK